MTTTSIPSGITKVIDSGVVAVSRAAVAAALFVGAPLLAPAPAQAVPMLPLAPACGTYQFKELLDVNLDTGATVTIPANGQSVGEVPRATYAIIGRTSTTYGDAKGGMNGRHIDITVVWDQDSFGGGLASSFTGEVKDDGNASGITRNRDATFVTGWHTNTPLVCVAAPVPAPAPMPKLPPPPKPPTDVISVSWGDVIPFVGLPVKVINTSATLGYCTYDASAPNSGLPSYHHDFVAPGVSLPAEWTIPGFQTGTQWHVEVSCRGDFNGQRVVIGEVDTTKTF